MALNDSPTSFELYGDVASFNSLIGGDPGFVDAANGDYRLLVTSIAVNLGDDALAVEENGVPLSTDIDGNARIVHGQVDIGAYEYQGPAATWDSPSSVVTTLADVANHTDGEISLREALVYGYMLAQDVTFAAGLTGGTVTLTEGELAIGQSVTIDATSIDGLTVDAACNSRVMRIEYGADVSLIGLTLTGGSASSGGGIYNAGSLTMMNSVVRNNVASDWGGGIYSSGGELTMTDVSIAANHAGYDGGGIGGGGTLTLTDSTVSDNSAERWGGGVYFNGVSMTLTNTEVEGNRAAAGGGIHNEGGTMTLTGVTIASNEAAVEESYYGGGGIYNRGGALAMTSCVVSSNTFVWRAGSFGSQGGGGVYNSSGVMTLTNCTVSDNTIIGLSFGSDYKENGGGGIFTNSSGTLILNNSIVAMNTSSSDHPELYGTFAGCRNVVGEDPGFVDPGGGDYRLSGTSLAINRGDNTLAVDADGQPLTTDLDGAPRFSDGVVDLGAYEYQGSPDPGRESPSTAVTMPGDITNATDGQTSLREALVHAMVGDIGTAVQFDPGLAGERFVLTGGELWLYGGVSMDAQSIGGIVIDAAGASRAIYVSGNEEVILSTLTITGGDDFRGGGIYSDGYLTLTNVTVIGNIAAGSGGGIFNRGELTMTNSKISGSTAVYGGGIYNTAGTLTLANVEVSGNEAVTSGGAHANTYGGGIYNYWDALLTLTNCTISGNAAGGGGGIAAAAFTMNNSIVALNGDSRIPDIHGGFTGSRNVIGMDPGFISAANGDYRLSETGLALNRGDNALAVDPQGHPLTTDLLGNPRVSGGVVDLGAYEYQGSTSGLEESSTVVTTLVDELDATDGDISLREALIYAMLGNVGAPITFAPALADGTIVLSEGELSINQAVTVDAQSIGGIIIDAAGTSRVLNVSSSEEVVLSSLTITGGDALSGGGIYCSGILTLTNTTVHGNTAEVGGGIYNSDGTMTLVDSTVSGNTAAGAPGRAANGGGILNYGELSLTRVTISANVATAYTAYSYSSGAGIYNYNPNKSLMMTDCTVIGNSEAKYGGGIFNIGTLTMANVVVGENSALYGAGLYNDGGALMTNCSVIANTASYAGGVDSGGMTLNNTVVALNVGGDISPGYSGSANFIGSRDGDPGLMPVLNALGEVIYYRPLPGSLLINNGGNALAVAADGTPLATDLPGDVRIFDGTVDIGAVEFDGRVAIIVAPMPMLSVPEGSSASFSVQLSAPPTGPLSITVSLLPGESVAFELGAGSVEFDASNWGQPQTIDVLADMIADPGIVGQAVVSLAGAGVGTAHMRLNTFDVPAQHYLVNSLADTVADDGRLTLREALQAANTNAPVDNVPGGSPSNTDVIEFDYTALQNEAGAGAALVIVLDGQELYINGDVAIQGYSWIAPLTIDASDLSRVMRVEGEESDVSIFGLRFTGGRASSGAGIDCFEASLTLSACEIFGNIAIEEYGYGFGGGIAIGSGRLVMEYTSLYSNTATSGEYGGGGALSISDSDVSIDTCFFTTNHAFGWYNLSPIPGQGSGGAIYFYGGSLTVTDSQFVSNTADTRGGAINQITGDALLRNCGLYRNLARDISGQDHIPSGLGGAVATAVAGGTLRMVGSTVAENEAANDGGGLWIGNGVSLANCTVSGNRVTGVDGGAGGGISVGFNGAVNVWNSTIVHNSVQGDEGVGGGIASPVDSGETGFGRFDIYNTIVAMNTATTAPDTYGTFSESTCFIGLRDGDPMLTVVDDALGRLLYYVPADTSPVVNAGRNELLQVDVWDADGDGDTDEILPIDQVGGPRVFGTVDIGSVETSVPGVADRHVFYNNSYFDGNDPLASTSDDLAIASDKSSLLPGETATFANYTNYSRGINGVMIDVDGLANPAGLTGADFVFKVGNDDDPKGWATAPTPSISVREGAGVDGSTRVTITWADSAIQNGWLQVTVKVSAATGLAEGDVFYFGNLPCDAGGDGVVDASDYIALKRSFGSSITSPGESADFDCSGTVDYGDLVALAGGIGQSINMAFSAPEQVTVPAGAAAEPEPISPSANEPAANTTMTAGLPLELPAASNTFQGTAGVLDALANSGPSLMAATPSTARPSYAAPLTRFALRLGAVPTFPSPLQTSGRTSLADADILQLAAPWWSGNSARHETPDEPWMTRLTVDIAGRPRKDRLDPIGLDVLAISR